MIDVKLLQKDNIYITNRKARNSPHSALLKSSRLNQSIVSCGLILVFNCSDIKMSLVKIIYKL